MNRSIVKIDGGLLDIETTMIYLHLTNKGMEDAYQIINSVMKEV